MAKKKNFPLRISEDVYNALEAWAGDELRSVNGHIEYLLRESLKKSGRLPRGKGEEQKNTGESLP